MKIVGAKPQPRRTVLLLKGTEQYAQWVDQLSRDTRIPRATLFDLALTRWALENGYAAPPKRL